MDGGDAVGTGGGAGDGGDGGAGGGAGHAGGTEGVGGLVNVLEDFFVSIELSTNSFQTRF